MERLPPVGPCCGVLAGVWLFFENSTGCLESQCRFWSGLACCVLVGWFGLEFGSKFLFVAGMFFKFLLESLILAQDERWRRA